MREVRIDEGPYAEDLALASGIVAPQAKSRVIERDSAQRNTLAHTIVDTSFDGLCIVDTRGVLVDVNPAFERLTGLKRSDWVGRQMDECVQVGMKAGWRSPHSAVRQVTEGHWPATTLLSTASGAMMIATANPHLGPHGKILYIIVNIRNITELNYLKYQLELRRGQAKLADFEKLRAGYLQSRLNAAGFGDVVVKSPVMSKILSTIMQIADFDTTVLLEGETGTGKGVLAKIIHRLSCRADGPFVEVNCGALPEHLVESELYGYQPGAFTGSLRSGKKGQFELANKGTIFLDEISELPLNSQIKLLKFLDDKVINRVGGTSPKPVDVRIVAATNQNLRELVEVRQFRKDLLYRLEVIPIYIPPLRERREDLKALLYSFLEYFNRQLGLNRALGSEAFHVLLSYDYPGNARELKNLMARLVLTAASPEITFRDLPDYVRKSCSQPALAVEPFQTKEDELPEHLDIRKMMDENEKRVLALYARQCRTTYELADRVGLAQGTIVRKLQKHGISLASRSKRSKPCSTQEAGDSKSIGGS